jgi:hypothetical protein
MPYPDNKKWRHKGTEHVREIRRAEKKRYRDRTWSKKFRRSWTKAEDDLIKAHTIPDRELAPIISRSVCAIQVRRSRLKQEG